RLASIEKMIGQTIENQSKLTTALGALEKNLAAQQKSLTAPVATMGAKVDSVATEVSTLHASIAEVTSGMRKMQQQMVDMSNAIKILQAPPAPPAAIADANAPPPGMTSENLYSGARRAQSAGQLDLALSQYKDYLRYYGQTDQA